MPQGRSTACPSTLAPVVSLTLRAGAIVPLDRQPDAGPTVATTG